jgi:oligopeptide transport system substrate-binding protein
MNKRLLPVVLVCLLIAGFEGCKPDRPKETGHNAHGGVYYGGVFRFNIVTGFKSLFPLNVLDIAGDNIINQVYEGLVRLNPKDLTIIPCLAKTWEYNDSTFIWTFHLRKGVKFHDDPCFPDGKGREVTAKDFKWCLDQLCVASPQNSQFEVTFKEHVLGADEYYQASIDKKPLPAGGVPGVVVVNDSTLQIKMKNHLGGFLNLLTEPGCCVYPKEALDKYGLEMRIHMVGTGPFLLKDAQEDQAIVLARNPNYWGFDTYGNQLPYLDAIKFTFVHEKKSELLEFQQGNLEMMYGIPIEIITQILGQINNTDQNSKVDYTLDVKPAMSNYFYGFQTRDNLFKNKYLRQAFNYAIDRDKIVNYTLQGEGIPGTYGIVPPQAFLGYKYKDLKGYSFDPDKARQLLAKAGYPNGKGFPDITIQTSSDGGQRNVQIAEVIQKMLKENLDITVKVNAIPLPEHEDEFMRGKVQFFREEWIADYADPQTFLNILNGANVPKDTTAMAYTNPFRWSNPKFDSLYNKALITTNDSARYRLYAEADQLALDDAPYLCVYYEENYYLYHNYVKNFYGNAMDYLDFGRVYIIPANKRVSNNPNPTPTINP